MNRRILFIALFSFLVFFSISLLLHYPGNAKPASAIDSLVSDAWTLECVDCPKSFLYTSDRGLQIDGNGHSHIAYGGDHLYYAWQDGTQWHYETIDPARGVGASASLALDSNDYPHVAYYDSANGDLKYAYQDLSGWHIMTIDSENDVGHYCSLALDTNDMPHISYSDDTNKDLKYAYFDGSSWIAEMVDDIGDVGAYNSIAMDSNNLPHISYYDATNDLPKYAHWTGTTWDIQQINSAYSGTYTSIAVDSSNLPHISFLLKYYSIYQLMYAHWNGSAWDIQQVDADNYSGIFTSITLDNTAHPRIAYQSILGTMKYALWNGTSWDLQVVDNSGAASGSVSLALDNNGLPRITYEIERFNVDPAHTLDQAAWDGNSWTFETIDNASEAGGPVSLALDQLGNPQVAYRTGVFVMGMPVANLSYAKWISNTWQTETVVADKSVSWQLSMAVDEGGSPHIAYVDNNTNAIRYASWTGSSWDIQTVGQGGYVSLAMDASGAPHLAFTQNVLVHVYWDGNAWVFDQVDNATAQGVSLAIDSLGFAHICYYQNYQIKYAWYDGSQWNIQTVDPNIGYYESQPALVLDRDNHPHISYYSSPPNGVLKYATDNGGGWEIQTVDSGGDLGNFNSIAVDSHNYPHISYLDSTNAKLKYAKWDGSTWNILTIADVGYATQSTSIKLDSNDNPYISYYDWSTRDVMLARLIQNPIAPQNVTLSGPENGDVQSSLTFTATTIPVSTTQPIKYVWEATNQAPVTMTTGLVSTADYIWESPGTKVITVTASNAYGVVSDTFYTTLLDVPISGLAASNDSPRFQAETTTFTATIISGTNLTYNWDFGDGATGEGASVSHIYSQPGDYLATVTATNARNSQTVNTSVVILPLGPNNRIFLAMIHK